MIQRVDFGREVGHEDIRAAVVVIIAEIDAHTRIRLAVVRKRDARLERAIGERSVAVIVPQELFHAVVGDEDVREAVAVVVVERHAQRLAFQGRNTRFAAHVREGAVAVVVIEDARHRTEFIRPAVDRIVRAAQDVVANVPIEVAGDEQVQLAVVIVIEKTRRGGPAAAFDARARRHVRERAIAIVVIEDVVAVTRDVDIREAVIVVVAGGNPHAVVPVAGAVEARSLRHIREAAIRVLAIQTVPVGRLSARKSSRKFYRVVETPAVDEENVEQPVVVVIEEGHSATHGFDQVLLRGGGIAVDEIQAWRVRDLEDNEARAREYGYSRERPHEDKGGAGRELLRSVP